MNLFGKNSGLWVIKNFKGVYLDCSDGWRKKARCNLIGKDEFFASDFMLSHSRFDSNEIASYFLSEDERSCQGENLLILDVHFLHKKLTFSFTHKMPFKDGRNKIVGSLSIINLFKNPTISFIKETLSNNFIETSPASKANIKLYINQVFEKYDLTNKEIRCLSLLISHHKVETISRILDLSTRTIEGRIAELIAKLNCKNRTELINCGINLGLSQPELDFQ